MKLNFLIIFVCSSTEGFRFPRLSSFKPSSFKPPSFKPPSFKPPAVKLPSFKLPSFKGGQSGGLDTFLNGANLVATLGLIGVEAIGMTEADRLQDEAMKNQAKLQQAQFDHDKNMAANKQAAEDLGAPNICIECYEELEKIQNVIVAEAKNFCSQFAQVPGWYDAEEQTCTDETWNLFFEKKAVEIFQGFGGKNNKCLKAKSAYLIELKNNPECAVVDDKTLRCIFDRYHQLEETKNSCY